MSEETIRIPWLPEGRTVQVPGRGEAFARIHRHADPAAPTLLLLHGWTASGDLQFFTAYEALAVSYSFVAVDHHGHGRGLRNSTPFSLEAAADDAAAIVRALDLQSVIAVGYSMGGPISMLLARRHRDLVAGLVVQATALEWLATMRERARWKAVRLVGPILRSWAYPSWLRMGIRRLLGPAHELLPYVAWLEAETRRGDSVSIVQAGRALSSYDARSWAPSLGVPAAAVITEQDRLVKPRKQRALAAALGAHVVAVDGDHLVPWERPGSFSEATLAAVDHVSGQVRSPAGLAS